MLETLRALRAIGATDLLSLAQEPPFGARAVPRGESLAHCSTVPLRLRPPGLARQMHFVAGRLPRHVAARDYRVSRSVLSDAGAEQYDLVWLCRAESAFAMRHLVKSPSVVDLDDLEDRKVSGHGWSSPVSRMDARRWRSFQRRVARAATAAVVCSDLDRERLAVTNAAVVPNAYRRPRIPAGRIEVSSTPTISFVGLLVYGPNRDAARYLAREIAPRVRAAGQPVRFLAIGRGDDKLAAECPGITFTGPVESIDTELARTDLVAAPLRFGSGTRIKILEAFAHRIPVVSTRIGAEGLAVRHDEHLLLADDPADFAEACLRLLRDTELRRRLVTAASSLWEERYDSSAFERAVHELVARIATPRLEFAPSI